MDLLYDADLSEDELFNDGVTRPVPLVHWDCDVQQLEVSFQGQQVLQAIKTKQEGIAVALVCGSADSGTPQLLDRMVRCKGAFSANNAGSPGSSSDKDHVRLALWPRLLELPPPCRRSSTRGLRYLAHEEVSVVMHICLTN